MIAREPDLFLDAVVVRPQVRIRDRPVESAPVLGPDAKILGVKARPVGELVHRRAAQAQPDWKLWATGFLPSETTGTPPHFRRRDQICELTRSSRPSGGPISRITTFLPAWPSLAARRIPEAPPPTITTSTFALAMATTS